jgi:hypothetical protein
LAKIGLCNWADQKIESGGGYCDELNGKAKTALKAETKQEHSERKEPEENFSLSRFLLFGF